MSRQLLHIPTATYWIGEVGTKDILEIVSWKNDCHLNVLRMRGNKFYFTFDTAEPGTISISEDLHEFEVVDI